MSVNDSVAMTEMPVAIGTPVEFGAGLKVMPANLSGTDAVPLIDGATAGILASVNSFTIKQRVRISCERVVGPVRPGPPAGWPRPADGRPTAGQHRKPGARTGTGRSFRDSRCRCAGARR